jgi:DNA-directed RNA polymerase subunit RPC12/RpoP
MLCFACGERMILLNAVPDRGMMVQGYEHQTLQCSSCGESEHRFIFKPVQSTLATSAESSSSPDDELTAPGMWERMVDRFRQGQATRLCLACSKEMALVAAVPDDNMMVPGYEHQTLRCPACGVSECRLIFNQRRLPVTSAIR